MGMEGAHSKWGLDKPRMATVPSGGNGHYRKRKSRRRGMGKGTDGSEPKTSSASSISDGHDNQGKRLDSSDGWTLRAGPESDAMIMACDAQAARIELERQAWVCERAAELLGTHPELRLAGVVAQATDEWDMYRAPRKELRRCA
jgi:hypothetical protein